MITQLYRESIKGFLDENNCDEETMKVIEELVDCVDADGNGK